jgi:hypothetical protein
MRALIISAAFAAAAFSTARAEDFATGSFMTGNQLHDLCREMKPLGTTYIIGVADSLLFAERSLKTRYFCLPKNVTNEQVTDVVCQSLQANPAARNNSAPSIAFSALKEAWPCQ